MKRILNWLKKLFESRPVITGSHLEWNSMIAKQIGEKEFSTDIKWQR